MNEKELGEALVKLGFTKQKARRRYKEYGTYYNYKCPVCIYDIAVYNKDLPSDIFSTPIKGYEEARDHMRDKHPFEYEVVMVSEGGDRE